MNESKYTKTITVVPSMCGRSESLSIPGIFTLFMDIASLHANALHVGYHDLAAKNLFWVTAKTMVTIHRLPALDDEIELATWPGKPEKINLYRYYTICNDGGLLVEGKTLWVVMNLAERRIYDGGNIYPDELLFSDAKAADSAFSRLIPREGTPVGNYQILSTDIDVGRHMNNVAYVRAFNSLFSCDAWEKQKFDTIEVHFKNQCFEGDVLNFTKYEADGMQIFNAKNGKATAVIIVLR